MVKEITEGDVLFVAVTQARNILTGFVIESELAVIKGFHHATDSAGSLGNRCQTEERIVIDLDLAAIVDGSKRTLVNHFAVTGYNHLASGEGVLKHTNVKTLPYPGFPTDMQPPMCALLCVANGTSVITEGVYDNRFKYVNELRKMGAEIQVDGRVAVIEGGRRLSGAPVLACDLRAGAAMVIAGMCAQGTTVIEDVRFIERGYENFVGKLNALGADISIVEFREESDGKEKIISIG